MADSSNEDVGRSGVEWVSAELSTRGLVVFPVPRARLGADLVVLDPETGAVATLKVRTSKSRPKFWPSRAPTGPWQRPSHFYVFVRRDEDGLGNEAFLVPAFEVAADVAANLVDLASCGSQPFDEFRLPKDPVQVRRLAERWGAWRP